MSKKYVRTSLVFAGLLTATMALPAATPVTVQVPFSFNAGGKSLPAGEYRIAPAGSGAILIAGSQPHSSVLALVTADSTSTPSAGVTFDESGSEPRLMSVQTSGGTWQLVASGERKASLAHAGVALRTK